MKSNDLYWQLRVAWEWFLTVKSNTFGASLESNDSCQLPASGIEPNSTSQRRAPGSWSSQRWTSESSLQRRLTLALKLTPTLICFLLLFYYFHLFPSRGGMIVRLGIGLARRASESRLTSVCIQPAYVHITSLYIYIVYLMLYIRVQCIHPYCTSTCVYLYLYPYICICICIHLYIWVWVCIYVSIGVYCVKRSQSQSRESGQAEIKRKRNQAERKSRKIFMSPYPHP